MKIGNPKINMTKELYIISLFLIGLFLIGNIYAITGTIGNARMVLRLNKGDKIDKCILVKNVNDVDVDIQVSPSGDLSDFIKIKEDKFHLDAGDEKKACFTLIAGKGGTTESKINLRFIPSEGGNGVGLSSTVIVISNGFDESESGFIDSLFDSDDENNEDEVNEDESESEDEDDDSNEEENISLVTNNPSTSKTISNKITSFKDNNNYNKNLLTISIGFTILLFVVLLILLYMQPKKRGSININNISKSNNSSFSEVKKEIKSKKSKLLDE